MTGTELQAWVEPAPPAAPAGAYCVEIITDLWPAYLRGERLLVDPGQKVCAGDDVVIWRGGWRHPPRLRAALRMFVKQGFRFVATRRLLTGRESVYALRSVDAVHRVVGVWQIDRARSWPRAVTPRQISPAAPRPGFRLAGPAAHAVPVIRVPVVYLEVSQ